MMRRVVNEDLVQRRLWEDLPLGRVVRLVGAGTAAVALTLATPPADAPVVITYRPLAMGSTVDVVAAVLDELEAVAIGLFPAWLPDAAGIAGPGGAGVAAVRALAVRDAPRSAQFGPFLADLAERALRRASAPARDRFSTEVRVVGLARVIANSYHRPAVALLVDVPNGLSGEAEQALVGGLEWLALQGGYGVWLTGALLSTVDWIGTVRVHLPAAIASIEQASEQPVRPPELPIVAYPPLAGRPHPQSRAEQALEAVLNTLPWAVGRAWNQTYKPRPLEPPMRLDLVWREERCVVEVDGPEHSEPVQYEADRRRDVQLHIDGYVVLRFTNDQIARDLALVVRQIEQFIQTRRRAIAEGLRNA